MSGAVPEIVAASWQRSLQAGVDTDEVRAQYFQDLDTSSRLVRSAQPIIDRLSDEAADIPLSIALTDSKARVLSRLDTSSAVGARLDGISFASGFQYAEGDVGTNGVGTVFEAGQPVHVVGAQHFHERLQPFACAGAPIRDPLTGHIEGVLDISCLAEDSNPLMRSLVRTAAQNIERSLLLDRSVLQQALFETFVKTDSRTRGAVLAVGGSVVMGNSVAQALFDPAEQRTIQEHLRYLGTRKGHVVDEIELPTGNVVRLHGTRVIVGDTVAGVVVEVGLRHEEPAASARRRSVEAAPVTSVAMPAVRHRSAATKPVSQSPLWKRACAEILAALAQHQALLVVGETGAGKFSLVVDLYKRATPAGRSRLVDAAELGQDSFGSEPLEAVSEPTLWIFRNIDGLSSDGIQRLNAILLAIADSESPAYVAATLSDANVDSELPFRAALVHFEHSVTVPPLRHRTEDIPMVVAQVLRKLSALRERRVSPAAMRVICGYSWPGNIRQLEEALRAALGKRPVGEVRPEDLPGYCHQSARRQLTGLEAIERDAIVRALHDADGNRVQAAAALGIARSSLYRKLRTFGIETI
ncbi:MAG: sigma-54 dependent transcriptional regulator, acetoin dehydrogenase operon transcriptional [Kribbellaceae bacterium]|nr:sigma-54 dependent transcriptional regulator, acetoin dehydrogenase operon transcriptional [Kribbellaceae bacterium]